MEKKEKVKIRFRQPKYQPGELVFHTDCHNAPMVKIVKPIRYEETDYGFDWVYAVEYLNGQTDELYQIDLYRRKQRGI